MFKAIIPTHTLQNAMKAIAAIVEEGVFKITPEGLSVAIVDASNSAMVSLNLPSSVFNKFNAESCEIGVDITRFVAILAMADRIDEVGLEIDEHTHKLAITMGGLSYDLALLDPSMIRKSPSIPQLDLPAQITLLGSDFKRAIKAASMTADHLRIGVEGNTFVMLAEGDTDTVRLDIAEADLIALKAAECSSLYALDYLSDISKGIGTAQEIVINLGSSFPVVINFDVSEDCPVVYILAPRIESD